MKKHLFLFLIGALSLGFLSCNDKNDQFESLGKVNALSLEGPSSAFMGDSLEFNFSIGGKEINLNTTRLQMLFDGEIVSERTMVTGESGNYSGKIFVPFLKDVSDGAKTVKIRVQNERFNFDTVEREITVTRPEFPYLTLVRMIPIEPGSKDLIESDRYTMTPTAEKHTYGTGVLDFEDSDVFGYIIAPAFGEDGNEITFGAIDGKITHGITSPIEFTSEVEEFEIKLNTQTYIGSPFVFFRLIADGEEFEFDDTVASEPKVEMVFEPGMNLEVTGLKTDYENYWVNPAFFYYKKNSDKKVLVFRAMAGKYRFTVNKSLKYFDVRPLEQTTFNGTEGSIWVLGNGNVGIPSYAANGVNWTENKAFPTARLEARKHLLVLEAGRTINPSSVNYKFFGQAGWGYEFTESRITISDGSSWFRINTGSSDSGNIFDDTTPLVNGKYYYVYLDHTDGLPVKMTVEEKDGIEDVD